MKKKSLNDVEEERISNTLLPGKPEVSTSKEDLISKLEGL